MAPPRSRPDSLDVRHLPFVVAESARTVRDTEVGRLRRLLREPRCE
jgi:hypothetical protein